MFSVHPGLRIAAVAIVVCAAVGAPASAQSPTVPYRLIAAENGIVPGVPDGAFWHFPSPQRINERSEVVFLGGVRSGQTPSLFRASGDDPAVIAPVALIGAAAPGFADGIVFRSIDPNNVRINRSGQVVFEATLQGPGIDGPEGNNANARTGWLWTEGAAPRLIYQMGTTPLGGPGELLGNVNAMTMNNLGHVAFTGASYVPGSAPGPGVGGLWYGQPGDLRQVGRQGAAAPGTGGLYFRDFFYPPVQSGNGRIAFGAALHDPGNPLRTGDGLFAGTPEDLRPVAYPGSPAPGGSPGTTIQSVMIGDYDLSDRGDVIFQAQTSDGTRAIYAGQSGALRLLAGGGNPAPGLPPGTRIDTFASPAMNSRGDFTFSAKTVAGDQRGEAIYAGLADGAARLLTATGRRAPDIQDDVFFQSFGQTEINPAGQVAFFGFLGGPEAREGDTGLFATDPGGQIHLIVRTGDRFDGELVSAISPSHLWVLSFESDELVFKLNFADGSEAVYAARVVPEPATFAVLALAPALLGLRRPRRG
jgi:hypothetical protein